MDLILRLGRVLHLGRLSKASLDPEKYLARSFDTVAEVPFRPTVDDEACSKLWKVFIDQAEEQAPKASRPFVRRLEC
ncbi:hypothetical protein K435DRAFT_776456 [Dendrothele bispora CBS 962.96]|uniref:Uncharacterized protein n=1 Tax=Dendrothele bispora (strain CBS 962.96) TaxID=1314807 RepID=A0A4S8MEM8_DENBC|nr:hypothetical protein K435DRAFT_776456 [Dendrothele bispora CBS 962.96]